MFSQKTAEPECVPQANRIASCLHILAVYIRTLTRNTIYIYVVRKYLVSNKLHRLYRFIIHTSTRTQRQATRFGSAAAGQVLHEMSAAPGISIIYTVVSRTVDTISDNLSYPSCILWYWRGCRVIRATDRRTGNKHSCSYTAAGGAPTQSVRYDLANRRYSSTNTSMTATRYTAVVLRGK